MAKKFTVWTLILTMLLSLFTVNTAVLADTGADLDLSVLSEESENTTHTGEGYSYIWTVEEVDGDTIRTLELTLDGANINTLTLPCREYGELHIVINTEGDSSIEKIYESHVFSYSYQWNSITFGGEAALDIGEVHIQGGGNDHMITVSAGANVAISDEYADLTFGASGSNGSSLYVYGTLSVSGNVSCGNVKIGEEGTLYCGRITLAGYGAFDTDLYANAFVIEEGGKLDAVGDTIWSDNATGEYYGALVVSAPIDEGDESTVIVFPEGYLPEGYTTTIAGNYVTIDNADENTAEETSFEYGVIYAATSLKLGFETEKYTIEFINYDGTLLQTLELEAGVTPVYTEETPQRESDDEFIYTFEGWTPDIEEVTGDAIYTATYSQQPVPTATHTITFDSNGGSGVDDVTVNDGDILEAPHHPTKSGYRFKGWYEDERLTEKYDFDKPVTSSFTLYAKWQKKTGGSGGSVSITYYTVKFETNGGSEIKDKKVARTVKLTQPEDPVKDDFIFDGWYTDGEFSSAYDFDTPVTEDFTLYAKWRKSSVSDVLNTEEHSAYIKGYEDNTVRPESNITRAETTEIFFRLLDKALQEKNTTQTNGFADVPANAWYNTSVSTMAKLGIIKGRTADTFVPDDFITRAEFAAICARFDNTDTEITIEFSDISDHWAEAEILKAAALGWILGYEDGSFRPDEFITRAEAVTLINRMLDRTPDTAEDLGENMITWVDNSDPSAWYYIAIQEATNNHSYVKNADGTEKWCE